MYHLDDKEFFPGDFVVQADSKCNMAILDYGVIQRVNAQARTAVVQWMKTDTKPEWIKYISLLISYSYRSITTKICRM